MPHVVYFDLLLLCPWPGCECRIEMIDFRLEATGDAAFYSRVMGDWGRRPGYGLIARCPGCQQYVLFGIDDKLAAHDPAATNLPLLPDDWYLNAYIA